MDRSNQYFLVVCTVAVALFGAVNASAQPRPEFDIQLRVDPAYAPTWVCAVIDAPWVPGAERLPAVKDLVGGHAYQPTDADPFVPGATKTLRAIEMASGVAPAFKALALSGRPFDRNKGRGKPLWSPSTDLSASETADVDRHVVCKQVAGEGGAPDRVAVVSFKTKSGLGWLSGARVVGSMLRIKMDRVPDGDEAVIRSIGSSYQPTVTSSSNGEATLVLSPSWETRSVRVGGAAQACAFVTEDAGDLHYEDKVAIQGGAFSLPVPHGADSVTLHVWTFDRTSEHTCNEAGFSEKESSLELEGVFNGGDLVFQPGVKVLRFSTLRSCELPAYRECPSARVPSSSAACSGPDVTSQERCGYTCTLDSPGQLPLDVRLTMGASGLSASWVERVVAADQALCTAPSDFGIQVVLNDWPSPSRIKRDYNLGDGISYVDVLGVGGEVYRLRPYQIPLPLLHIPSAASGAKLRYAIVGDRIFSEDASSVEGGLLLIAPPENLAHHVEATLNVGGGFGGGGSGLYGPFGAAMVALRYLPSAPTWYLESRLGLDISGLEFDPFTGGAETTPRSALFARFMLDQAFFWRFQRYVNLGASLGFGVGYPYLNSDQSRVGGLRGYVPVFTLLPRVPLPPHLSIDVLIRVFPEWIYSFAQPINDYTHAFRGNPVKTTTETPYWMFGVGLTVEL